ncbi:hypothetical protein F5B18DRAFT_134570 [Nemania serpens]|nr:hypothetical protein F5B18DRAFT_134570 [Nemania serpens]
MDTTEVLCLLRALCVRRTWCVVTGPSTMRSRYIRETRWPSWYRHVSHMHPVVRRTTMSRHRHRHWFNNKFQLLLIREETIRFALPNTLPSQLLIESRIRGAYTGSRPTYLNGPIWARLIKRCRIPLARTSHISLHSTA